MNNLELGSGSEEVCESVFALLNERSVVDLGEQTLLLPRDSSGDATVF